MKNEIVIYQSKEGQAFPVRLEDETVWLNRQQMAELFGRDVKTIGKHIGNALKEELADEVVVANFATTTPHGAIPGKTQTHWVEYYNLDMILSVGYRVKSQEGVYFRRWATSVLRQHLLKGYTVNPQRLAQLHQVLNILSRSQNSEIAGISSVLGYFSEGLDLLDEYDHQTLGKPEKSADSGTDWVLTYEEARKFVDSMKFGQESELFGREKDEMFQSALGAIYQTFDGKDVYPTPQEKAANLLYLVVKNHAFIDGNKRIAAALFAFFLEKQDLLFDKNRQLVIDNSALAAMTLMIALSRPEEKNIMCLLVMNMLIRKEI